MEHQMALEQYIAATNTHRFANVQKLLHEEAVYYFTDKTCRTVEEIGAYFEAAWNTVKEEVYAAKDVQWLVVSELEAVCVYTYTYKGYVDGCHVFGEGRATNVFERTADGWKLKHEHLSGMPK